MCASLAYIFSQDIIDTMCFSAGASITSFSIGLISLAIFIYRESYSFAIFYLSVILMQFIEYFAHISLEDNDTKLNELAAKSVFALIVFQPVLWALYNALFFLKDGKGKNKLLAGVGMFLLFSLYFYQSIESRDGFVIETMVPNCKANVCRLDWSFLRTNTILSLLFVLAYIGLFTTTNSLRFPKTGDKSYTLFSMFGTLLALAFVYMIFIDKERTPADLLSGFGSIWCIACALAGPVGVMYPKMVSVY